MSDEKDELHLNNEVHPSDIQGHDEDRLPWLEAVEPDADHEAHARKRVTGVLLAGAGALALLIGGLWWINSQTPPVKGGDGKMIAAAEGDYKSKPVDAGGMKVEGQGDAAAATAQGAQGNGKIDNSAQPEAPVTAVSGVKPAASGSPSSPNVTVKIADVKPVSAPTPAHPAAATTTGAGFVQLGAYGSEASAEQGWAALKGKYAFLAPMAKSIVPATVGGTAVYRLRAAAGDAAADTCAKLKAGGANCLIAH